MALDLIDDNDINKKKDQPQQDNNPAPAPASPQPQAGAAPSQPGSGINTTGQGPQASNAPQQHGNASGRTGSGFVNLQNVISANRQNKLGSTINQGLQGVAGNVRQGLQSNQDLFQQEMDKNRLGTDQDVQNRQDIINRISGYQAPESAAQAGGSQVFDERSGQMVNSQGQGSPQALGDDLVSQQDADAFQRYRSGAYQGPQSLRDVDSLQEQAQQAEGLGKNISSSGGRQALLQQFVGRDGNYSRGKQALDSLLLGQTGAQDLRNARKATFGLNNEVGGAENLAEQQAAATGSLAQQFGQDTRNTLGGKDSGGMIGDIYGGLTKAQQDRQSQADTDYGNFQQRLANKQLTQQDVEKYLNPLVSNNGVDQGTSLFGLDNNSLSKGYSEGKFGLEDVADTTKLAKINALQKLSGTNDIKLDPSKLGANRESVLADPSQFNEYRGKQDELNTLLGGYNDLLSQTQGRQDYYNQNVQNQFGSDLQNQLSSIRGKNYSDNEGNVNSAQQAQDYYNALQQASQDPRLAKYNDVQNQLKDFSSQFKFAGTDEGGGGYKLPQMNSDDSGQSSYGDPRMADFLQSGNLGDTLKYDKSADIGNLNKIMGAIKTQKGAGDSVTSLMSDPAKQAYNAAHPTQLQQVEKQGDAGLYDQSKYQQLHDKYLGENFGDAQIAGKRLSDYLGPAAIAGLQGGAIGGLLGGGGGAMLGANFGAIRSIFSDEQLKTNVESGGKRVERFLDSVKPYEYDYKNSKYGAGKQIGVMAQDLEKTEEGRQAIEETSEGKKVHYGKLAGMMMASQAHLHKRLKALEGKRKK